MSEKTLISWADSTINFWIGCEKVSPGCKNCYADEQDARRFSRTLGGGTKENPISHWGKGAPRYKVAGAVKDALAFNRKPWICPVCSHAMTEDESKGYTGCPVPILDGSGKPYKPMKYRIEMHAAQHHRRRIFSLSLGDIMDEEVEIEMLYEALFTIWKCRECVWILCSKRWQNFVERMAVVLDMAQDKDGAAYPETEANAFWWWLEHWITGEQPPKNIILLTSVENQEQADKRIPELLKIPAACHGLSMEPLLGPVNLDPHWLGAGGRSGENYQQPQISWLIVGGESGANARPCHASWIYNLIEQGKSAGVATFCKQLGSQSIWTDDGEPFVRKMADKKGGDMAEWPQGFKIQQWPKGF